MKKIVEMLTISLVLLLSACSSAPTGQSVDDIVAKTMSAIKASTQEVRVETVIVVVTDTPLPFTPTSLPPTAVPATPEPTIPPLYTDKMDGFYLVGSEVGYGKWRTDRSADNCYWSITDTNGNIVSNDFGMGGSTFNVTPQGYQLELTNCGITTYLP